MLGFRKKQQFKKRVIGRKAKNVAISEAASEKIRQLATKRNTTMINIVDELIGV